MQIHSRPFPFFRIIFLFLTPFLCLDQPVSLADTGSSSEKSLPPTYLFRPPIILAQADSVTSSTLTRYDRCIEALKTGDTVKALQEIQQAIFESPANLEYQYMMGNVYFHMGRYNEAENIFNALLRKDPVNFQKSYFDLSAIYLRKTDFPTALDMLEHARQVDDGRVDYESGIIYMQSQKPEKAIPFFEQAVQKKPEIAYECRIQQVFAYRTLNQPEKAKAILNEILLMDLSPERLQEVKNLLDSIQNDKKSHKPWLLYVSMGMQYDDNVFQKALDQISISPVPGGVSQKDDVAYLATIYGRYDMWQMDEWKAGLSYFHYQLTYRDLTENNLTGARPSVFLEWNRNPFQAKLEYAYNRYWVDLDPRVDIHALLPRLLILHNGKWQSELYGGVEWRFYLDESPDDRHYYAGLNEYLFFWQGKAHIRAGYMLDYDNYIPNVRGDARANQFQSAINLPVWDNKIQADICGIYLFRNIDYDPNIDADEKRRDHEFHINMQLYGNITSKLMFNIGYFKTFNDSNTTNDQRIDPYHFQRAVYSVQFIYSF